MKNPLRNLLTPDEQKILLFILFFGFIGISLQFFSKPIAANETVADTLNLSKDFQIKYDLRTCTKEELQQIPRIGPSRAQTIIEYREQIGFNSLKDIKQIKGIGDATFEIIKPYLIEFGEEEIPKSVKKSTSMNQNKININIANIEELTQLPGIGPAKAKKIVQKREELNGFKSIEQITEVKGIGEKSFEKLKNNITIGEN